MNARLRLGVVNYLNALPLAWGFLHGDQRESFDVRLESPARIADLLAAGELDAGLVPSIELQRIPDLVVVPGLCIAATHEVRSVLLISRGPIEDVRRVALDRNSRTSAALVHILFTERWGRAPEYSAAAPDAEAMLRDADAALVIGDPALHVDRDGYRVVDLAAEWRALTGLPFVFAVWAVRPDAPGAADLGAAAAASLEAGLADLDAIVAQGARSSGLGASELRAYLTGNLRFELGAQEQAGLEEFHRRARVHGLV